jgi:hypothetical protein
VFKLLNLRRFLVFKMEEEVALSDLLRLSKPTVEQLFLVATLL